MEQQLQQERIVIENDDEIEIDLKDLVLEILSFWKWVLFALIIGAVTAYCISRFVMVPQYESTSQFYVLSKSMSITSLADIQTGTSLTNDYMVIVEGRPVLEQVIENLGLDETYSSLLKHGTPLYDNHIIVCQTCTCLYIRKTCNRHAFGQYIKLGC
jgi:capsular polysaccharide biosynthesis protein